MDEKAAISETARQDNWKQITIINCDQNSIYTF